MIKKRVCVSKMSSAVSISYVEIDVIEGESEGMCMNAAEKGHVYSSDILAQAMKNEAYRRVLNTAPCQFQIVLMSLAPGETIPPEIHERGTQFIFVVLGNENAYAMVENEKGKRSNHPLKHHGSSLLVYPNTKHEIRNDSKKDTLKLISIYSPPEHARDLVQKDQPIHEKTVEKARRKVNEGARIFFNGKDDRYFLHRIDSKEPKFGVYDRKKRTMLSCGHVYESPREYLRLQPRVNANPNANTNTINSQVSLLCPHCHSHSK